MRNHDTETGTNSFGSDLSNFSGVYLIWPLDNGGVASIGGNYSHTYSYWHENKEYEVGQTWWRGYVLDENGNVVYKDGEGPKNTPTNRDSFAYAGMKITITGEGTKKVHITAEVFAGVRAKVTFTSVEAELELEKSGIKAKVLGSNRTIEGDHGVELGTTKEWDVESICVEDSFQYPRRTPIPLRAAPFADLDFP